MPRLKGKRKGSVSKLEQIGPALIPAAALTAVPWCPGPYVPDGRALTLALNVFPRMQPLQTPGPESRTQGEPSGAQTTGPSGASAAYLDDDDDDGDFEEAGYTTVRPIGNRKSYSERERVPTPPTGSNAATEKTMFSGRNVATESQVTQSGDSMYHILEPEDEEPEETDIYALPKKLKGLGTLTLERPEVEESSLDRTQQDVRRAMQAIHDTPVEETMMRLSESRQATGSTSGRGTMWREDDSDDEPPPLPPPPVDNDRTPPQSVNQDVERSAEPCYSMERPASSQPILVKPSSVQLHSMEPLSESDVTTSELVSEVKKAVVTVKCIPVTVTAPQNHQTEVKEPILVKNSVKRNSAQLSSQKQEVQLQRKQDVQMPRKQDVKPLLKQDMPSLLKQDTPSPLKRDTPSPLKQDTPSSLKQDVQSPRSAGLAGSDSGGLASQFSATPRDVPSLPLECTPSPVSLEPAPSQQTPSLLAPETETTMKKKQQQKKKKRERQSSFRQEVTAVVQEQRKMAATTPVSSGGRSGSRRSHRSTSTTLQGVKTTPAQLLLPPSPSPSLKKELARVKEENQTLHNEVTGLRKMAAAIGAAAGSERGFSLRLSSRLTEELKGENEVLKNAVGRLNQELSQYQAAFRPLSQDDQSRLQALPQKGPVPAWLINKRYLSPLFLAYDDLIQEKEEVIRRCQAQLQTLKQRTEEIVRENKQYQKVTGTGNFAVICASDWQALQEQARLVLEENQILTEQVNLQHRKVKDLCSSHMHEVGQLTQRLMACEQEREDTERELEEVRSKLTDIKQKHDRLQLEALKRTSMYDHINSMTGFHRSVIDEKEQFEKEKEEMLYKLKASDDERKRQILAAVEVGAENQQLKAELCAMQHAVRRSQNRLLLLRKAILQSESKELVTQNELANVIKMVEKTALERDTAVRVVKEQQKDCSSTVSRIADSSVIMSKMDEKLKMYKLKASAKLQTIADKLKEQDDLFNRQRQEYEREIVYLRTLLKEKEDRIGQMKGEQREVEESLETVWQAAQSENQQLKESLANSVSRLHKHPALHAALQEEEDLERLLHFSA